MSELIKKSYEISLWDEEFVYIITEGSIEDRYETTILPSNKNYKVLNQYSKENCLAVIGSDKLNTPIRVFDPKLTRKVTGENTLTFQIYSRYYDDDEEVFKTNPFINLLLNERKVKLFYDNEWFDFIIKEIQEKSEDKVFTYTCKDQHITELSKSGYNIEFDTTLENNQGTIVELGEKILEESDWNIDKDNSELIQQKDREALYTCTLPYPINAVCMADFTYKKINYKKDQKILIPKGEVIYVFYSTFSNKENPIQFLYYDSQSLEDNYVTDEDGIILNSPNWSAIVPDNFFNMQLSITTSYFGEKLVSKHRSKYVGEIDKYCNIYTSGSQEYYGYLETEYATVTEIQNLLVNSNNFISTNGWTKFSNSSGSSSVSISNISLNDQIYRTLRIDFGTVGKVINNGLYDNRRATQGFTAGEKYIFALQYSSNGGNVTGAQIGGTYYNSVNKEENFFTFTAFSGTKPSTLANYVVFEGTCSKSLSYEELLKYNINFYVTGTGAIELIDTKLFKELKGADGLLIVPDLEKTINSISRTKCYLFPRNLIDNVSPRKIFSTDDITFSTICYEDELSSKGYTPLYSKNYEKIRSITASKSNRFNLIQELCETFECWAKFSVMHDSKGKTVYEYRKINKQDGLVEGKTYYKKLTQSEDNTKDIDFRVATNQELFFYTLVDKSTSKVNPNLTYYKKVGDEYEELLYNEGNFVNLNENPLIDPTWGFKSELDYYIRNDFTLGDYYEKYYYKNIVFKRFVGQDNPVGFRYGINLKSIQRTINSDQITTKMIVEPNTNEFAENNSCTIQTSVLNPTGENIVYNFEYYIRHNLLDRAALYNDLYGTNGGLGLYTKLRDWNNQTSRPIEESAAISNTINILTSRRLTYSTIISESKSEYEEAVAEIMTAQKCDKATAEAIQRNEKLYDDFTNSKIIKRDEATSSINRYQDILNNTLALLEEYNNENAALTHKLNKIANKKKALNTEFYKKYSRFIQEGTWTSADYIDPEDYYLDSQMVLYTSAFPKVTYNINVIEISQVEGFEPYFFRVGDKTYMEDTEFFGWQQNGKPYQEEIIVSEVSYNLDDPSKNTIKVQNFKTQFEDLFQRIAATTQSLQYHEGEYKRAASAINADGSINSSLLQNSLGNNSLILKNAKEESVYWDETGITISNFVNPNNIVRLVSGGIVLSSDGGRNWTTGITGEGINANVITTGRLDTNRIRIFNSTHQTFEWNDKGINAFLVGEDGIPNYSKFVRFDQFGLYGYTGETTREFNNISDVLNYADFSLTWKGLKIKLPNTGADNQVINVNDSFIVYGDGSISAKNGNFSGVIDGEAGAKIKGLLKADEKVGGAIEGISLNIGSGAFKVDGSGNLTLDGSITFGGSTYGNLANFTSTHGDGVGLTDLRSYGITQTSINRCSIESPLITGNNMKVYGTYQTIYKVGNQDFVTGYIGAALGSSGEEDSYGVALSAAQERINFLTTEPYLIVNANGVRMTAGGGGDQGKSLFITSNGVFVSDQFGKAAGHKNLLLIEYIKGVIAGKITGGFDWE